MIETRKSGPRRDVDWFLIRKEFEDTQHSITQIGERFGVAHTSIMRRAKKEGWIRGGLPAAIEAATERELIKRVGEEILTPEAIEEAVRNTAEVIKTHRTVSQAGRALAAKLLAQLLDASENRAEIEDEIFKETMGDRDQFKRNRMLEAVSLPGNANTLKTLSIAAANFIKVEREAFGLDSLAPGTKGKDEPYDPDKEAASDAYNRLVG